MIQLIDKSYCCGCSACEDICPHNAIEMHEDEKGFLYPLINKSLCINCDLCTKVCPIIHRDKADEFKAEANPLIFGCYSKDDEIVKKSSSGGLFSTFAQYILQQSGIVYGAAWSSDMKVKHIRINSTKDLYRLQGSKYVQSNTQGIYNLVKKDLLTGASVLFSGTPCQIEALRLYLRKDYSNLYTIDLVCHAVPSPLLFKDFISFAQNKYKKRIVSISLRDKSKGWSRNFHSKIYFEDGTSKFDTMTTNLWNNLFFSFCIDRDSCHECRFTNYQRPGDITLADYWFLEQSHPDKHNPTGVSLTLVNTPQGNSLFNNIQHKISAFETTKEESTQPCLLSPTKASERRDEFWQDYTKHGFKYVVNKYTHYRWDKMLRLKVSLFIKTKILHKWIH